MPATATHLQNLIKIATVPKAKIYGPWWRFEVKLLSPAISAGTWFDRRCVTSFQVPRVANFPTSLSFYNCVTMDGNLATVHSACSMLLRMLLEQRWNVAYSMLLRLVDLVFRNIFEIWWFDKRHVEKWMWCGSGGSYDDFFVGYWKRADCCQHLQTSNLNCAIALSILVTIVNFSVTTTCVYINSTYKCSISMDTIVEI